MLRQHRNHEPGRWVVSLLIGFVFTASASLAADEDEGGDWSGELALGITAQSGTTDTFSGSIDIKGVRSWDEKDLVSLRFSGVYGTTRSRGDGRTSTETIQNSQSINGDWKRTLRGRFLWKSGSELSRDNTQDRELRVALNTGPGYRIWKGADLATQWMDVSLGLGYLYEVYDGNRNAVQENTEIGQFADVVVGFEIKNTFLDDRLEYTQIGTARMPVNQVSAYVLQTEIILGVPLTETWSFRTKFLFEYVAEPGSDEVNNTTTRTSVGLGYKF